MSSDSIFQPGLLQDILFLTHGEPG